MTLWDKYYSSRGRVDREMCDRGIAKRAGGGIGNELWLLHGTRSTVPKVIWQDDTGFDFRFCEKGMFGRAAYFAEKTEYSDSYRHTQSCSPGEAQMFLARVAAGNIEEKSPGSHIRPSAGYHSIRGCVSAPGW